MKKQFFLSIAIVLSSISTLRSMDLVPQENQKDQSQQFKELNERFNQFIETSKKQKTYRTNLFYMGLEFHLKNESFHENRSELMYCRLFQEKMCPPNFLLLNN